MMMVRKLLIVVAFAPLLFLSTPAEPVTISDSTFNQWLQLLQKAVDNQEELGKQFKAMDKEQDNRAADFRLRLKTIEDTLTRNNLDDMSDKVDTMNQTIIRTNPDEMDKKITKIYTLAGIFGFVGGLIQAIVLLVIKNYLESKKKNGNGGGHKKDAMWSTKEQLEQMVEDEVAKKVSIFKGGGQ